MESKVKCNKSGLYGYCVKCEHNNLHKPKLLELYFTCYTAQRYCKYSITDIVQCIEVKS
jgi:hypothetical protein